MSAEGSASRESHGRGERPPSSDGGALTPGRPPPPAGSWKTLESCGRLSFRADSRAIPLLEDAEGRAWPAVASKQNHFQTNRVSTPIELPRSSASHRRGIY